MKALPLWQPYATLVAIGAKKVETRAYPPRRIGLREGQRIAIHACKTQRDLWVCAEEFFIDHVHVPAQLPLGAPISWTGSQGTFDVPDDLSDAGAGQLKDPQLAMEVS